MSNKKSGKKMIKIIGFLFFVLLSGIVLFGSQCSHQISSEIFRNDYTSFYKVTAMLRKKESTTIYFTEQKSIVDFERKIMFVGYADDMLKNSHPASRQELLENTILDMIQDPNNLFCFDNEIIDEFLSNDITPSDLKHALFAGYTDDALQKYKTRGADFASYAKKLTVFIKAPLKLDTDFCEQNSLPYKNGLLGKEGIPYRVISQKEYDFLVSKKYPIAPFLLRESENRIVNMLPNCAQGATQLLYGNACYTKVSQLVSDKKNLFVRIDSTDKMRIGDCIAVLWDNNADAATNSGHTGVVIDIEYDKDGHVTDGTLIEFFPANHSPRLVKISRSMYSGWKNKISANPDSDIFLLRAKQTEPQYFEPIVHFLQEKYPDKKIFVLF